MAIRATIWSLLVFRALGSQAGLPLLSIEGSAAGECALELVQTRAEARSLKRQPASLEGFQRRSLSSQAGEALAAAAKAIDVALVQRSVVAARRASFSAFFAELVAMMLYVVVGCGSAMAALPRETRPVADPAPGAEPKLQSSGYSGYGQWQNWLVSLTFGLAAFVLSYAVWPFCPGVAQFNFAITLGLMFTGRLLFVQGVLNFIAQMFGATAGAFILIKVFPLAREAVSSGEIFCNRVRMDHRYARSGTLLGEMIMTFFIVFIVLCAERNRAPASLAMGLAVFLAHLVLLPVDGCSTNPARSFGPAFVAKHVYYIQDAFDDMWIFWSGPFLGAGLAAAVYAILHAATFN